MATVQETSSERSHAEVLQHSQLAPQYLQKHSTSIQYAPSSFIKASESVELWNTYEQLLISCLKSGDDKTSHMCLERLTGRFGSSNERVTGLNGMHLEATADNSQDLEKVLKNHESTLLQSPTNGPLAKRRIALLRSMGKYEEAVKALNELLGHTPVDAEAWAELSDIYFILSLYPQALFCLEEVLLIFPNAWNVHARLGDISYLFSMSPAAHAEQSSDSLLASALHRYCRSIELCDGYLRGWCGVKMATNRLIEKFSNDHKGLSIISGSSFKALMDLNHRASELLSRAIAQQASASNRTDIAAARELLDQDASR